jgi:hypothetical protein
MSYLLIIDGNRETDLNVKGDEMELLGEEDGMGMVM